MEYTQLGKTDLKVSKICFGTLWIGGVEEADAIASLNRALEKGINFVDASDGYGAGRSEEIIGKVIKGKRAQWIVATKCGLDNGQLEGVPRGSEFHVNMMGQKSDKTFRNSSPAWVAAALDASLARLGTDYVDLYQIHYPDSATAWADTIGAMEKAKEQGKIRYWGVSNFDLNQLKGWTAAGALHSLQPMYNMLDREIEDGILSFCREQNIAVLPYSTLAQLAIAWALAQPGITSALVAAKSPAQVDDNAGIADVSLGADDLARIDDILAGK